ncbi:protealysin inhibitor emfourin [Sinorhizobium sp. BG8]|uniref:protealysin inhibitor emfourin n=1 Tax=Sinorhizobium sp. BG8 TaxID=2613773 RepID=UPI00193D4230|nr:protealysin inhibitor emfourin [Sinorhizobium sp. BG8]
MDDLKIERIGGLAGFGLPKSRIKSRGAMTFDQLSESDKKSVEQLFATAGKAKPSPMRDSFICRITWQTTSGVRTIEVPEEAVPSALTSVIRDELE